MSFQESANQTAGGRVLQLEHQWVEAMEAGDRAALDRLTMTDFEAVSTLGRVFDKDGWLAIYASHLKDASGNVIHRNWKIKVSDLKVRSYPGVAIARGIAVMETQHYSEYFSHLWVNSGNGWRLALIQATPLIISPVK